MPTVITLYSYIVAAVLVLIAVAWSTLRRGIRPRGLVALALTVLALAIAQTKLRVGTGTVRTAPDLRAVIGQNQPVLFELYSNF